VGKTSSTAKQNWNSEHYTQVKVSVRPEIAAAFKSACEAAGLSMTSALSGFMEKYPATPEKRICPTILTSTRRHRRNALKLLLIWLKQIIVAEERYRDNIPDNLAGSCAYDAADECVSLLSEAAEILESAYP
jgi:hypothetical protein